RVEPTNYRTVRLPTGMDVPLYVKDRFQDFYRALFDRAVTKADMRAVFLEYAWDMNWCDPCAADPLSFEELRNLGVFWASESPPVPRQSRLAQLRGTFSSRVCMCVTTPHIFLKTSCSKKPPIVPTSRVATCCATLGLVMMNALPRKIIGVSWHSDTNGKHNSSPTSQAGTLSTSARK